MTTDTEELARRLIEIDGYVASRNWAIKCLATTLGVEADPTHSLESYASLAAEQLDRLAALRSNYDYQRLRADFLAAEKQRADECVAQLRAECERLHASMSAIIEEDNRLRAEIAAFEADRIAKCTP
jgi:hypothetical protein